MAIYKYLRKAWRDNDNVQLWRDRMTAWRKQPATVRVERPLCLDKARNVGYKAKQGFIVVRQRVDRGGRMREKIRAGRRPRHNRRKKILKLNYQRVAEGRADRQFPNLTVLNSYLLCKSGTQAWYEIILIDPQHKNIRSSNLSKLAQKRGRVDRGLTMAGRRGRGMKAKGKGHEKNFPSLNARKGLGN